MKEKPQSGFTLRTAREHGGYNMLYLAVLYDYTDSSFSNDKRATLKYQANHDTPFDFYGGHLEIEVETLIGLEDMTRLIKRIFKPKKPEDAGTVSPGCYRTWNDNFNFHCSPAEVVKLLWGNLPQVVNDPRLSKYIPIKDVLPASFHPYRDHWKKVGYDDSDSSSCTVGCIAENDDEARRLLTLKFCEGKSDYYAKRFAKWAAAGRPLWQLDTDGWDHYKYPEFTRAEDLLKQIAQAQEERKKAQEAKDAAEAAAAKATETAAEEQAA